jgi:hypothetical protein
LKSAIDTSFFLAIKKQDVNNGGLLEITNHENPTIYWKFDGA